MHYCAHQREKRVQIESDIESDIEIVDKKTQKDKLVTNEEKKIWKLEDTSEEWKRKNIETLKKRLTGWQLESFEESYTYKLENGISLFKKNLKNE